MEGKPLNEFGFHRQKNEELDRTLTEIIENVRSWINSTSYPPPEIKFSQDLNIDKEKLVVTLETDLFLPLQKLEELKTLNISNKSLEKLTQARMLLPLIRGEMNILKNSNGGTNFQITVRLDDPVEKIKEINATLFMLLHPMKWLKTMLQ